MDDTADHRQSTMSARLRALGDSSVRTRDWLNYADIGVTAADIPELLQLMRDPGK